MLHRFSAATFFLVVGALTPFAAVPSTAYGAGRYVEVQYPASKEPGKLIFSVTFTAWIPDGLKEPRAIIVHQHGCGGGACKGGATAAYDLHWQALAKKWDAVLLGPSYGQEDGQNCRMWCDPRNGSEEAFLNALKDIAEKAGMPGIAEAPWCLWGHSGGGFWASIMQTRHPQRIAAIWCRSGTAFTTWNKGDVPKPEITDAVYQVPVMMNPGFKEKGDKRFDGAWTGSLAMFREYRAKGSPIGFAPDPKSSHDCGDSRYMAIPFFDSCLQARLPEKGAKDRKLRPIAMDRAFLAAVEGDHAVRATEYKGVVAESVWLPDERFARVWLEYTRTGAVTDSSQPPTPFALKLSPQADGKMELTWDCIADLESGLAAFLVLKDGKEIARIPEKAVERFGKPLFQAKSYHDTPEKPLPAMRYVDPTGNATSAYKVVAVNTAGLKSDPATPAK